MDPYPREPEAVTLDIDDSCDFVHGHQQLSLYNAKIGPALLSAHPRLQYRAQPPGHTGDASGQDAIGRRGASPRPAPRPPYPRPLQSP